MSERLPFTVKFHSRLAKMSGHDCITIRSTIYRRDGYIPARTLSHEYAHVEQWHELGVVRFVFAYLWEQIRRGYKENRFEKDAHAYADAHSQEFVDMDDK